MYWLEEKRRTTELPGASQMPTLPPSSFGPSSIPTPLRVLNCVQSVCSTLRPRLSAMDSEPDCEQEPFGRLAIVRDPDTTVRTTLALDFPRTDSDEERVHVALDVDASPGCGGIAWPAGEVGSLP